MTPRDLWRMAGWAARLALWSTLRQRGVSEDDATKRTGVRAVLTPWRRSASGGVLTFTVGGEDRMVGVREWVVAGASTFAVGDLCVWCLSTETEKR